MIHMGLLTTNWKSDLHRLAMGGAWFFAVASLIPLLWLGLGFNAGSDWVFGATVDGQTHTAWGLTYSGFFGAMLKWFEFLGVSAAIVLTAAPRTWVPHKWSRIGHGALIAWATLWTLGASHMASVSPGFFGVQAGFLAVLLGCTAYRAWRQWGTSDGAGSTDQAAPDDGWMKYDETPMQADHLSPPTDVAPQETLMIHLRDVKSSAAMREVQAAAPPTTWIDRIRQTLRETFNRGSMQHAAHQAGRFTVETARAAGNVGRAIGQRFVAAAKAWKSYDAEESSTRA